MNSLSLLFNFCPLQNGIPPKDTVQRKSIPPKDTVQRKSIPVIVQFVDHLNTSWKSARLTETADKEITLWQVLSSDRPAVDDQRAIVSCGATLDDDRTWMSSGCKEDERKMERTLAQNGKDIVIEDHGI